MSTVIRATLDKENRLLHKAKGRWMGKENVNKTWIITDVNCRYILRHTKPTRNGMETERIYFPKIKRYDTEEELWIQSPCRIAIYLEYATERSKLLTVSHPCRLCCLEMTSVEYCDKCTELLHIFGNEISIKQWGDKKGNQ